MIVFPRRPALKLGALTIISRFYLLGTKEALALLLPVDLFQTSLTAGIARHAHRPNSTNNFYGHLAFRSPSSDTPVT